MASELAYSLDGDHNYVFLISNNTGTIVERCLGGANHEAASVNPEQHGSFFPLQASLTGRPDIEIQLSRVSPCFCMISDFLKLTQSSSSLLGGANVIGLPESVGEVYLAGRQEAPKDFAIIGRCGRRSFRDGEKRRCLTGGTA